MPTRIALNRIDRAPRTVIQTRAVLSIAMSQAVVWELITSNPVAGTKTPKADRPTLAVPKAAQVPDLLAAVRGTPWEVPVALAAATGARRGEVLALWWENVDLERDRGRDRVTIVASVERFGGVTRFKDTKTDRSRREVALPTWMVDLLRRHRVDRAQRRLTVGPAWHGTDGCACAGNHGSLVCDDGIGGPVNPDTFSRALKRAAARVGFDASRLHDLRHAAVTTQLERGVHISVVSQSMGHSSEAFTMAVYGHVSDERIDPTADALESYGEGSR